MIYINNIEQINAYNWTLALLPTAVWGNCIVWSNKRGLYSIGGKNVEKRIYHLVNFGEIDETWNETIKSMDIPKIWTSATFFDNDDKLIIVGGYPETMRYLTDDVVIYDFNTKKWQKGKSCINRKGGSGICYDKNSSNIYVCGGTKDGYKIAEYYNIEKNQWYQLPDMNKGSNWYPAVWKTNNLLYIASIFEGSKRSISASDQHSIIEFIDLRASGIDHKWSIQYTDIVDKLGFNHLGVYSSHLIV